MNNLDVFGLKVEPATLFMLITSLEYLQMLSALTLLGQTLAFAPHKYKNYYITGQIMISFACLPLSAISFALFFIRKTHRTSFHKWYLLFRAVFFCLLIALFLLIIFLVGFIAIYMRGSVKEEDRTYLNVGSAMITLAAVLGSSIAAFFIYLHLLLYKDVSSSLQIKRSDAAQPKRFVHSATAPYPYIMENVRPGVR